MLHVSKYSNTHKHLDNILHICDKDWHGVRNAASYSPGHKFLVSHREIVT